MMVCIDVPTYIMRRKRCVLGIWEKVIKYIESDTPLNCRFVPFHSNNGTLMIDKKNYMKGINLIENCGKTLDFVKNYS